MNGKPATKECKVCHHRFPVTNMRMFEDTVYTGKSGWSMSFDLNASRKPNNRNHRAHTGRKYYSKKTYWVCNSCAKTHVTEEQQRNAMGNVREIFWAILAAVIFVIWLAGNSGGVPA